MSRRNQARLGTRPEAAAESEVNADPAAQAAATDASDDVSGSRPEAAAESAEPPSNDPKAGSRIDCKVVRSMLHGGIAYYEGDAVSLDPTEAERREARGEVTF